MGSDWLEKMKDWLDSEEGKLSMEKFIEEKKVSSQKLQKSLENFHEKYKEEKKFKNFVERVIAKYDSDDYVRYWYSKGIEPPEELFWYFFEYARKYGRECTERELTEHANMFTSEIFYARGYFFNRMDGQGSVIKVTRE
jgi:hypothetical protein